eukprot:scaffold103365_cov75-Phaeocystis_antarctica.AAC.1
MVRYTVRCTVRALHGVLHGASQRAAPCRGRSLAAVRRRRAAAAAVARWRGRVSPPRPSAARPYLATAPRGRGGCA